MDDKGIKVPLYFHPPTTTINSTSFQTIHSQVYTAVSASSYIIIEYDTAYDIDGYGADTYQSEIKVAGTTQNKKKQTFINGSGGGGRGATIFPISCRYTNSSTGSRTILINARYVSANDEITIDTNNAIMKITEIAM